MHKIFYALLIVLTSSLSAGAQTTTSFVEVTSGVFNNPGLSGFTTYAMRVTAVTDWTNANMAINLTSGTLNHVAPAFLGSPNGANGLADTAGLGATNVLGDLTGGFNGVIGFAGTHEESPTTFSSSWFTTETDDIGTFDIAMITLSNDANGSISWRTISGALVEDGGASGGPETFEIVNGAIVPVSAIPEPSSFVLAGLGVIGILLRRKS